MQNQTIKQNTFIVTAVILSLIMIFSIAAKFSFLFSMQVFELLILLILAGYFCNLHKFKINSYIIFSILLLSVCFISYFYADFQTNVKNYIIILSSALLAGFNMMFLSNDMKKKILIVPVFIAVWLSMVIFSRFISNPQGFIYGDKFYDVMALNVNVLAGFLVLIYPLFFICIKTIQHKKVFISLTMFVLFAIILTRSRIAIILAFILTLIFLFEYRKKSVVKILLAIFALLLIACVVYVSTLKSNFHSISERIIWWKTAFLIFKENIFVGCGLGNYTVLFKVFRPQLVLNTLFAHNIIMQLMAETGILGLISFVGLIISFYINILNKISHSKDKYFYFSLSLSITAFLIINIFDYSFFAPACMMIFFIIFCSAFTFEHKKLAKERINTYILICLFICFTAFMIRPILAQTHYNKGIDWYVANQYKFAVQEFEKAINLDKKNPEYYAQVARAYFALYDQNRNETGQIYIDKAIEYNKEAIKLYKHSGQLRMMLASYYWNDDKKDEAINIMQEALKYDRFNPKFEEYLFELKNS